MLTLADVERRKTNLRELKIVGTINTAFLWATIWNRDAALLLCSLDQDVVERRETKTGVFDVARFAPDIHAVDVDVGQCFLERVKWMFRIKFRAEQAR